MTTAILAAALVLALVVYLLARHAIAQAGSKQPASNPVAQFVYTAPTANDARITLPASVQNELLQIGLAHRSIALTRIESDGNASTSLIDMTPRTGDSLSDPVLLVNNRAVQAIEAKISAIENDINSPASSGSQALYAGLTKISFTDGPVTVISTGLDLANPDNFRSLNWSISPRELVAVVKNADELPALHGPVTFVVVPTAGAQPQLGQREKNYRNAVWTALLTAAGATSIRFIDANGATASPGAPSAPAVQIPTMTTTPISQKRVGNTVKCTLPTSYFVFDTAKLVDAATTEQELTPCIDAALAAHASFALDGFASYQGPLNARGRPEFNYAFNRKLSRERVQTIDGLLTNDLGVPRSSITRMSWHGNLDQPDPSDPSSPANQVVVISYTTK